MIQIAIDASVIVGLLDTQDKWHIAATVLLESIDPDAFQPIYFDCCVTEAVSAVARRFHEKQRSAEFSRLIDELPTRISASMLTWILPDVPRLYAEVLRLTQSSSGELNVNDSLIALACQERGIAAIASFDRDFDSVSWLTRVSAPSDVQRLLAGRHSGQE